MGEVTSINAKGWSGASPRRKPKSAFEPRGFGLKATEVAPVASQKQRPGELWDAYEKHKARLETAEQERTVSAGTLQGRWLGEVKPIQLWSPGREVARHSSQSRQLRSATIQCGGMASKPLSTVGRREAVRFTSRYNKPKLGYLIHHTVSPFSDLFGDLAAGNIGRHYKDRAEDLDENVTRRKIIKFAITETRWWNEQPGIPGSVGSAMSKRMRARILLRKAEQLGLLSDEEMTERKSNDSEE